MKDKRDKIAEIIGRYGITPHDDRFFLADSILALFPSLEGIEVEEKCVECGGVGSIRGGSNPESICELACPYCHGTGEITRQAEWGDIDVRNNINECGFILDRVEKLKSQLGYVGEDWLEDITKAVLQMLTTKSGGRLRLKDG